MVLQMSFTVMQVKVGTDKLIRRNDGKCSIIFFWPGELEKKISTCHIDILLTLKRCYT